MSAKDGYHIHADKIAEEIARGTSVILTSNPRNPTGHSLDLDELAEIQDICRDRATIIFDEFYAGFRYDHDCDGSTISAAANVVDVNDDDVIIIDGLTKRFRLPGVSTPLTLCTAMVANVFKLRVCWLIGKYFYTMHVAPH